jgi:hypothetical protein
VNAENQTPKVERRVAAPAHRLARGTWSWVLRVALLLAPVLIFASAVGAQTPPSAPASRQTMAKTYMSKNVFYLPVIIDERARTNLREVQLYVKENPTRPWMLKEKAPPSATGFTYRGMQDGEYWFAVVTVDKNGRMTPADLAAEPPGLVVVLDTQLPQVEVRPLPASGDGLVVRCEVRDANPDPMKTRLEYQTADRVWRGAAVLPNQPDTFVIPQQALFNGLVRVSATDRAGNSATREINLGALAAGTNPTPPSPAVVPDAAVDTARGPAVPPLPQVLTGPRSGENLMPEKCGPVLPHPDVKTVTIPSPPLPATPVAYQITESSAKRINTAPGRQANPSLVRQIVNNTHVFLEYQIEQQGPSGVGKVEVWLTRDQGQSWARIGEDPDRKSPVEVDLPSEGLFGVSLVVSNGRGFGGTPPSPGDAPDWWIEVDVTKPTAELLGVQPAPGQDDGGLVINWSARDKNFGPEPIDLYYSIHHDGPWQVIAKGLKNEGHYRWAVPNDAGAQAYVRIVATDRAGNTVHCDSAQPVALDDLSRPRGHVIGVATTPPRTSTVGN